jgi:hypothetical protein
MFDRRVSAVVFLCALSCRSNAPNETAGSVDAVVRCPDADEVSIVPLRHRRVADLACTVNELAELIQQPGPSASKNCVMYPPSAEPRAPSQRVRVEADLPSNSLVVHAQGEWLARVIEIIAMLDESR